MIVHTTSLDYVRGEERYVFRVIPILLIRACLMDVILLTGFRIVLIPRRAVLLQRRILIEVQYRGGSLLYLIDPRRFDVILRRQRFAVHVPSVMAVHLTHQKVLLKIQLSP